MEFKSISIGGVRLSKVKFMQFLKNSSIGLETIYNAPDLKILSKEINVKLLEDGDERISKVGRKYLTTKALTKKQHTWYVAFFVLKICYAPF